MDHHLDARDEQLLAQDPYTFATMRRILREPCDLVLTDHRHLILCHSAQPYPVWLWTPDGLSAEDMRRAWELAAQVRPLHSGFRYNIKHDLAECFIAAAQAQGDALKIATQLYAYDCPAPIAPEDPVQGQLHVCTEADLEEVADLLRRFHDDISMNPMDTSRSLAKATEHIQDRGFFLWKVDGETVSCCSRRRNGDMATIASVYTLPAFRRRHYAQQLVYQVTRMIVDQGLTPMLYADADYEASNACYVKIGYVLRGRLCTIAQA